MYVPGVDLFILRWWKRWVYKGRKAYAEPLQGEPGWRLHFTARYKISMVIIFLLFSTLYTWGFFIGDPFGKDPTWKRWAIFAGSMAIWVLVASAFLSAFLEKVCVSEVRFTRRSLLRGTEEIPWASATTLSLQPGEDCVLVGSDVRRGISVSLFLDGLGVLLPFLERRFGPEISLVLRGVFPER